MTISAIIKASNISNHFPDRYTTRLQGKPLLEFIVHRLRSAAWIQDIILTTSDQEQDDALALQATSLGAQVARGPFDDSLGRLYNASQLTDAEYLVRIPGHYPFVSLERAKLLYDEMRKQGKLYAYNENQNGQVLGTGVTIVHRSPLEDAESRIQNPTFRISGIECLHSTVPPDDILAYACKEPRPQYRVSLAVPNDTVLISELMEVLPETDYNSIKRYLDANPILVKFAQQNIVGHSEVGQDKLLLFPNKIASITKAMRTGTPDKAYPISVELSLTNRCNLDCAWCSDRALRQRSMGDLDFDVLMDLVQDLAAGGTKGIVVEGGGEPTLYHRFDEAIARMRKLGLNVGLITNGVRPIKTETLKHLEWVRFSLDAANADQFKSGKGKDHFDTVIANIQSVAERKTEAAPLVVGVGYVLTKNNTEHLELLTQSLSRIGADYIQIRPVVDAPDIFPSEANLDHLEKYTRPHFSVNLHNLRENVLRGNQHLPCHAHSLSSVIAADGKVYLCGRLNIFEWFDPIGNVNDSSFRDIWMGETRRSQTAMLDENFCNQWCPECRMTKYNVILNNIRTIKTTHFI